MNAPFSVSGVFWEGFFEHRDGDMRVTSLDVIFDSPNDRQALADMGAFWKSRQIVMPEHFGRLLAFKLYPYRVPPIVNGGLAFGHLSMRAFEWKCDTAGCSFETWIENGAYQ